MRWSPPEQNAQPPSFGEGPLPVMITAPTSLDTRECSRAVYSASTVFGRNALRTSGRLKAIRTAPTSRARWYVMSSKANPATGCQRSASKISETNWFELISHDPCRRTFAERTRGWSRKQRLLRSSPLVQRAELRYAQHPAGVSPPGLPLEPARSNDRLSRRGRSAAHARLVAFAFLIFEPERTALGHEPERNVRPAAAKPWRRDATSALSGVRAIVTTYSNVHSFGSRRIQPPSPRSPSQSSTPVATTACPVAGALQHRRDSSPAHCCPSSRSAK